MKFASYEGSSYLILHIDFSIGIKNRFFERLDRIFNINLKSCQGSDLVMIILESSEDQNININFD